MIRDDPRYPVNGYMTESSPLNFYSLTRPALRDLLVSRFEGRDFNARQIFRWVYASEETDFSRMSDLGRDFRAKLASAFVFRLPEIAECQISTDGTRKYLLRFAGGDAVEAVMIKQAGRMTLCISSQVGCAMGCTFCRTALMKLKRNLTADEIVGQVLAVKKDSLRYGDTFNNIVYMGMGEPLHNYPAVVASLSILTDEAGLHLPPRKITVSTSGLVPAIRNFAAEKLNVSLAVSLNASNDEVRSQIMPVNRKYPLKELLAALREFPANRRRGITIEYVMLAGLNDASQDVTRLVKLLHGLAVKVNLIPYNENAGLGYKSPTRDAVRKFQDALVRKGVNTTIRWSKGEDIKAACGQLASV